MNASLLHRLAGRFERSSRPVLIGTALGLVALIGLADRATGIELSFSVFYVAPIAIAAWYVGARAGVFLSFLAAAVWLTVDVTSGHAYVHAATPYWNAGVRLAFFVTIAALLAVLRERLERERRAARLDPLTGLLNRRALHDATEVTFDLCRRMERPVAVAYLDLDRFKEINDTRGHDEGDRVLRAVARTLRAATRRTDLVGRIGGDEFVLVLPDTEPSQVPVVVEKLIALLRTGESQIGASVGVVVFRNPPADPETAFLAADRIMYRVKGSGEPSFLVGEPDPG